MKTCLKTASRAALPRISPWASTPRITRSKAQSKAGRIARVIPAASPSDDVTTDHEEALRSTLVAEEVIFLMFQV